MTKHDCYDDDHEIFDEPVTTTFTYSTLIKAPVSCKHCEKTVVMIYKPVYPSKYDWKDE